MKAYLVTSGAAFGLVFLAHVARLYPEPHLAGDPWFVLTSTAACALAFWALRLLRAPARH